METHIQSHNRVAAVRTNWYKQRQQKYSKQKYKCKKTAGKEVFFIDLRLASKDLRLR